MRLHLGEGVVALAVALALAAASWLGLSEMLGAHPWWAARCGVYGAGIGFATYLVLRAMRLRPAHLVLAATLSLAIAVITVRINKGVFVSAADFDANAGRNWFFGWIAIWAALALLIPASLASLLARKDRP